MPADAGRCRELHRGSYAQAPRGRADRVGDSKLFRFADAVADAVNVDPRGRDGVDAGWVPVSGFARLRARMKELLLTFGERHSYSPWHRASREKNACMFLS
jgi:hypothetical protein